jgi:predicted DNA-binding protein (MmcQ/YjbR family)
VSRSGAFFDAIREHCLAKPGATLDHPWGEFAFKIGGKMFAVTGEGSPLRITVKARPEDQDSLCTHPAIDRASYVGRFGWVTVTVRNKETLRLALDLVDASFLLVARRGERKGPGATSGEAASRRNSSKSPTRNTRSPRQ